jgi:very-short-patch-repair endonuclease
MHFDPVRTLADIAARQDGIFTIDDARRAGLGPEQIQRKAGRSWFLVHECVYRAAGAPRTWRSALRAAVLAAGDGAAISHRSAAALYELPGGRRDLIEITCIRWKRTTRPGLVVHESTRLDPRDIQLLDGLPVTRPERVILDLASRFPAANYLELIVQAARRKRLVTYESTRETFDRNARRGLKGVRALRETLERWDPESRATESEMETLLLQALRENGLPEPVVQYVINDAAGRFVARADAAYPPARIAIEYDSKQEHSDEFQIARDARRRNALQATGFVVLSARHADLREGGTELAGLISAIMSKQTPNLRD